LKVLSIAGPPGSGKTTLLVALLPLLRASGLTVSTIKYTRHGFDMDQPGKDSHRHRLAGAHEVLVASGRRWALLHEVDRSEPEPPALLAHMEPVDLLLVEGLKSPTYPTLVVHRQIVGKPSLSELEPEVVAVASDATPDIQGRILLPLNMPETIATWIRTSVVTDVRSGS
jgi:molybdopterin-guanine dinucleotide biosynthesis protein B